MLNKLLKHEWRATARMMLPLYAVLILYTGVTKLFYYLMQSSGSTILKGFGAFVIIGYAILLLAVVFLTFFLMVQRFYKNLMTDEGYLSHTLPVRPSAHVGSKLINSFFWQLFSFVMIILSLLAVLADKAFYENLPTIFRQLEQGFLQSFPGAAGGSFATFVVELIVYLLLALVFSNLLFYLSIAVGQILSAQHKVACSFAAYLVLYTVIEIVLLIILMGTFLLAGGKDLFSSNQLPIDIMELFLLITGVLFALASVGMFTATSLILKRRLNLE